MKTVHRSYRGFRFPPEIISHSVWLYHRFCLSFRDVQPCQARRGTAIAAATNRSRIESYDPSHERSKLNAQSARDQLAAAARATRDQLARWVGIHG